MRVAIELRSVGCISKEISATSANFILFAFSIVQSTHLSLSLSLSPIKSFQRIKRKFYIPELFVKYLKLYHGSRLSVLSLSFHVQHVSCTRSSRALKRVRLYNLPRKNTISCLACYFLHIILSCYCMHAMTDPFVTVKWLNIATFSVRCRKYTITVTNRAHDGSYTHPVSVVSTFHLQVALFFDVATTVWQSEIHAARPLQFINLVCPVWYIEH